MPVPWTPDDERSMRWWITWAVITANQGRYQAMLAATGREALQVYDDFDAILRNDMTINDAPEPIDTHSPRWNNTAPL